MSTKMSQIKMIKGWNVGRSFTWIEYKLFHLDLKLDFNLRIEMTKNMKEDSFCQVGKILACVTSIIFLLQEKSGRRQMYTG